MRELRGNERLQLGKTRRNEQAQALLDSLQFGVFMGNVTVILQICDLHLANAENPILGRVDLIVAALRAQQLDASDFYVAVTGDIAFSGTRDQYALAKDFFRSLLAAIAIEFPNAKPQIVFTAGNHDCDLLVESDIRSAGIPRERIGKLSVDGGFFREFLAVQNEFREFASEFGQVASDNKTRLYQRILFKTSSDQTVAFTCLNSAWMSTNPENTNLFFPNELHGPVPEHNADLEVTLIHHPTGWFQPENAAILRDCIEHRADIVLTGHEHRHESYRKDSSASNLEYVAGRAMYDKQAADNGFNLIVVDVDSREYKVVSLVWKDQGFTAAKPETRPFVRNKALQSKGFVNNSDFLAEITGIGTGFTHPNKNLKLADVFVLPNLLHREYQRNLDGKDVSPRRVKFRNVPDFVLSQPKLFILGADRSGKTSFAKTVYRLMQTEKRIVPVLVDGSSLNDPGKANQAIDTAYCDQYSRSTIDVFRQLGREDVCIIVDDLHKATISTKARMAILQMLERRAGHVILLATDTFDINKVLHGDFRPVYWEYRQYAIEELNRVQRGILIEKWVSLGRPSWQNEDNLNREIKTRENAINTLLGQQLLPAYPVIVLAFLQTLESMRNPSTINGSYGELYESLITERIAAVSKQGTDVGILYAVVSRLAYHLYSNERNILSTDDIQEISDRYFAETDIRRTVEGLVQTLTEAGILARTGDSYRFVYRYYYHYFVARYLHDHLKDATGAYLREKLRFMADRVYYEDYSNIIVFYLYFNKDLELIDQIVKNARMIYHSYAPCSLENDVGGINQLSATAIPAPAQCNDDIERNREALREALDDVEEQASKDYRGEKLVYEDELDDIIKLNIGFKTIHILGQVLRSFPGDLKKELKIQLAEECYLLGLRILAMAVEAIDRNSAYLQVQFLHLLRQRRVDGSVATLGDLATKAVFDLAVLWSTSIVKTLSSAVGIAELSETYKGVLQNHSGNLSVRIIDAGIRLDHFGDFPERQLDHLHDLVRKNAVAYCTVRNLLLVHFQQYHVDHVIRQKYANQFRIAIASTRLVEAGLVKDNSLETQKFLN